MGDSRKFCPEKYVDYTDFAKLASKEIPRKFIPNTLICFDHPRKFIPVNFDYFAVFPEPRSFLSLMQKITSSLIMFEINFSVTNIAFCIKMTLDPAEY